MSNKSQHIYLEGDQEISKFRKPETSHGSSLVISLSDMIKLLLLTLSIVPYYIYQAFLSVFKSPKHVENKICLVTGAGRGLGRELCLRLASLGAEVVCVDIREEANTETVKLIKEAGGKAHGYVCNVAKYDEVARLAGTVQKEVGRVYLLVNNAALIMIHQVGDWQPEDVTSMFNVNVISHYWTLKAFLPAMKEVNDGHIVNVVSLASMADVVSLSVYGPTKAAAECLLRYVSLELNMTRNNNIKVSGVYPSVVNTSEDIGNLFSSSAKMVSVTDAVDIIIEGIIYDKQFIFVPNWLRFCAYFMKLLPEYFYVRFYEILKLRTFIPSDKTKQAKAFGEIREKCL